MMFCMNSQLSLFLPFYGVYFYNCRQTLSHVFSGIMDDGYDVQHQDIVILSG